MGVEENIRNTVVSSIVSLFAHTAANSRLTRSFTECKDIEHKNDCMRIVLEAVKENRDLFIIKLESIINLHSRILENRTDIIFKLNRILGLAKLRYDEDKGIIASEHVPSVLLSDKERYLIIDEKFSPDSFYNSLIEQINVTFLDNCYTATTILLRKIFENLLIDLLRKKYGTDKNKQLYWNVNRKHFLSFSKLIDNLKDRLDDFHVYTKKLDNKFIEFLKNEIQFPGNESAHTIEERVFKNEIEERKEKVNEYVELLFSILGKI